MATRSIGKVTTAAASGGAVGAALAGILVWLLTQWGIDAGQIEAAISVVLTAGLGLLGGYLVPAPVEVEAVQYAPIPGTTLDLGATEQLPYED